MRNSTQSLEIHHVDSSNNRTAPPTSAEERLKYFISLPPYLIYSPTVILFVIGVPSNCAILYYLYRSGKYKTNTFCTITSLSMADMITCLSWSLSYLLTYPYMPSYLPAFMCKLLPYVAKLTMVTSIFHLVLFSAIRFYQLVYPLQAKIKLTWKFIASLCAAIWVINGFAHIPRLFTYKTWQILYRGRQLHVCGFRGDYRLKDILTHIFEFIVPALVMMTLHAVKFFKVNNSLSDKDLADTGRKSTVHKAMYAMIVVFLLTWLPAFIHDTAHEVFGLPYPKNHIVWYLITDIILSFNNCANPYIYMLMAKPIRDDILSYICPSICQKRKMNA